MFKSRREAGERLGAFLKERRLHAGVVLGLPRGGVVVAAAVARILGLPVGVLVVRKLGHPFHREFAVGALAESGVVILDEASLGAGPTLRAELDAIIKEEMQRLQSYEKCFHASHPPDLAGKAVLIVDDGLATGATTQAAVLSARKQGAASVTVGAPVASLDAMRRLARVADDVLALCVDPDFDAVGRYYESFAQVTDQEVIALLAPPPR
jgi:predicted phosphoribosyltransferase